MKYLAHLARTIWQEKPHALCGAIIAVTVAVRLWFIFSGQLDLVQDEAQYWDWSRRLQLSYYSKGPLIAWIIALFTGIFGDTEAGVRFGAVLGSLLAQLIIYLGVGRLMNRPRLAALTLFIANTTPLFIASGVLMTTDNPLLVCWLAALFSLHGAALRPHSRWPWLVLAASVAIGLLGKYTMLGMAGVAVIHGFSLQRFGLLPAGHWKKLALALGAGTVVGFAPILAWNAQNDWVSFRHVGRLAGVAPAATENIPLIRFDRFPEYAASQLGLILPWWLVFMLMGGVASARAVWNRRKTVSGGVDDLRIHALLSAGFWPIWLFFLLWSFHTRIYANWSAMSYAAGLILAAWQLQRLLERAAERRKESRLPSGRKLAPLWIGLGLAIFLVIHAQEPISRFLPDSVNPAARLKGWSDLGRHLDAIRRSMPDPDRVFFFSDSYDVTASIAFYIPGQPITYCADFGRRLSQYDVWPGPEDKKGWDAVYVRRRPIRKPDSLLLAMFGRIGQPEAYLTTHRGRPAREFGVLSLQGFTGDWPRISRGIY